MAREKDVRRENNENFFRLVDGEREASWETSLLLTRQANLRESSLLLMMMTTKKKNCEMFFSMEIEENVKIKGKLVEV